MSRLPAACLFFYSISFHAASRNSLPVGLVTGEHGLPYFYIRQKLDCLKLFYSLEVRLEFLEISVSMVLIFFISLTDAFSLPIARDTICFVLIGFWICCLHYWNLTFHSSSFHSYCVFLYVIREQGWHKWLCQPSEALHFLFQNQVQNVVIPVRHKVAGDGDRARISGIGEA